MIDLATPAKAVINERVGVDRVTLDCAQGFELRGCRVGAYLSRVFKSENAIRSLHPAGLNLG